MNISGIKAYQMQPKPIEGIREQTKVQPQTSEQGKESFGDMFGKMIKEVNNLQQSAEGEIQGLVVGKEGATTHSAMMALEKADIAFQLMNNIRAKLIRAYEEILRTQV